MAVEAMLSFLDVPYRVIDVDRDAERRYPDWFVAINPMAQVPVLELPDGNVMTESAAMMIHLADSFPEAQLAPELSSSLRPQFLRWMLYLATTVYMSDLRLYYPAHYTEDANGVTAIRAAASRQMAREWDIYAAALGKGPFILGLEMSAVDIYAAMLTTWSDDVPGLFAKHPNLKAMHDAVAAVPRIATVWARHGS
jgi:glutathione S-transferase